MVLGITGGYCAGKDAVSTHILSYGFTYIDEDQIGHLALERKATQIIAAFGQRVVGDGSGIDRRELGNVVFADPLELKRLESIVHPWMVEETRRRIQFAGDSRVLINAAILRRMGLHLLCDVVCVVTAPFPIRIFRGMKRDHQSIRRVIRRIRSQPDIGLENQILNERGSPVDIYRVGNGGSKRALSRRVDRILSKYGITGRNR